MAWHLNSFGLGFIHKTRDTSARFNLNVTHSRGTGKLQEVGVDRSVLLTEYTSCRTRDCLNWKKIIFSVALNK